MIYDLLQAAPVPGQVADVAVVGAGAAGIVLAVELARLGRTVTLLEGGGAAQEQETQDLYRSELSGLPHRGIHAGRFRVLGGTTTMWGGQILEFDELDFEQRSWIPGSGWPIHKQELAPFYARALASEGVARSIREDHAVLQSLHQQFPNFPDLEFYLSRWCPEPDFARLHRSMLEDSSRIQVWLHANAIELLMQDEQATGVRCRTLCGREWVFHAREYVFALGAIESSRFFLQPRSAGSWPWSRSGHIGRHFQDHIDSTAAIVRPHSSAAFHQTFDSILLRGFKYNPKLRLAAAAQAQAQVLNVGCTMAPCSEIDEVLAETKATAKHILHGRFGELTAAKFRQLIRHSPLVVRQGYRYVFKHRAFYPASAEITLRVHCEQQPDSESAIALSDERDRLGLLRSRLCWCISPLELRTIRRFVEIARSSLADFVEIIPTPDLFAEDDRFSSQCLDSFHHMGGMRMSSSPLSGVVDPSLRLFGTNNTYICSSAVFPTSGFSNPTHTLLALTVRLADHLATNA